LTFVSFKSFISLSLSTDANCSGAGAPITLVIPWETWFVNALAVDKNEFTLQPLDQPLQPYKKSLILKPSFEIVFCT